MIVKRSTTDLKIAAMKPVTRLINPAPMASANQKLEDGRRVICTARRHGISGKLLVEWYINQEPITELTARVALANG